MKYIRIFIFDPLKIAQQYFYRGFIGQFQLKNYYCTMFRNRGEEPGRTVGVFLTFILGDKGLRKQFVAMFFRSFNSLNMNLK